MDDADTEPWIVIGLKAGLFAGMLYLTSRIFASSTPWTFMDAVNLVFHEAGHLIFYVTGQFMAMLGGSLMQLFIPIIVLIHFYLHRQWFGCLVAWYWLGTSLINVSVYIKDARTMALPLLGGGIHDWQWLLSRTNLLAQDQIIGGFVYWLGAACLIGSLTGLVMSLIHSAINSSTHSPDKHQTHHY